MSGPHSLQAVVYAVDLERLCSFYADVCGLVVLAHAPDDYTVLGADGLELSIVAMPREVAAEIEITSPPRRIEDASIKLSFPVPSLSAARDAAARHGGIVDNPDQEWDFRGHRVCHGHDPEGNVVSFREPLEQTGHTSG